MARRVREVLLDANSLLTEADLRSLVQAPGAVGVHETVGLLHKYALIVNDGHPPCGGKSLVEFMRQEHQIAVDDISYWLYLALGAGRVDVAVAFGAGDYALTGEAAVLGCLRSSLRVNLVLEWWGRNPEFCRRIDPAIETLAGIPEFPSLAKLASSLAFFVSFFGEEPDWKSLKAFRESWWSLARKHGEDTLFSLLERFDVLRPDAVRQRLAMEIPGEQIPEDYRTLGLQPGASEHEVNTSFRKLAQRHHPDKGGNAAEFTRIQQARERLISGTNSI